MAQTKLTIAEVMKYPNARVMVNAIIADPFGGAVTLKNEICVVVEINLSFNSFITVELSDKEQLCVDLSDCKLILKSLSDISEGDAVEALAECGWDARGMGKIIVCKMDSIENIVFEFEYNIYKFRLTYQVADKLRELNYALPNLPESVWVDEKSLQLTYCQANDDDYCNHPLCPQIRDGEPAKTNRHCPIHKSARDSGI